jgi:hypothetical protein
MASARHPQTTAVPSNQSPSLVNHVLVNGVANFFHGLGRSMGVNWSSEAIYLRVDHIIIYLTTNDAIVTYQHLRRHAKEAITCDKQQKGGIGRPEG